MKTSFNSTGESLPRMHQPHLLINQLLKTFSTPVSRSASNHRCILGSRD